MNEDQHHRCDNDQTKSKNTDYTQHSDNRKTSTAIKMLLLAQSIQNINIRLHKECDTWTISLLHLLIRPGSESIVIEPSVCLRDSGEKTNAHLSNTKDYE